MITKAIDILQSAKRSGVHIYLDKDQLQLKFSKGKTIDPVLLEEIKKNKELIITFLNDSNTDSRFGFSNETDLKVGKRDLNERIPLSFSQERLWFIDKLEGSTHYHMPAVLRLKGKLDKEALIFSLKQIVDRHEVLKTIFIEENGEVYQKIKEQGEWHLSFVDGSAYKENGEGLKQFIQPLINNPFDLSKDYMLRAHLITVDADDNILVVTMHHIASDGWSRSVLVKEVMELYRSSSEKTLPRLQPLPVQYADYASWQKKYLSGEVLENKLHYWKTKLGEVAPLQLPTDYPRPLIQSTKGASAFCSIDKLLTEQLQEFSLKQGATMFMTLLTAFKVLLYRYSGQSDICVGSPIAGRQQQELEGLIGFFANTLALRTEVNDDTTFTELLQQVRRTTIEAQEHQEVPFERVVDAVVKERSLSRTPLTQVMFALQNTPEVPALKLGEIQFSREPYAHTTAMFDISFFVNETASGLGVIVEYSTELFKQETIGRMMIHFRELLSSIIKTPQQKIGNLPMLTSEEETSLLQKFHDNKVDYPMGKTIVDLFEEAAAKNADSIALIFDDKKISYKKLNESANRLAHYLKAAGIKKEMIVAVCIGRGIDMVVAILAILKAGGAYVPVDPEYPSDRIGYMLEDSKAVMVLCSKASRVKIPAADGIEIIELNDNDEVTSGQSPDNLLMDLQPQQLAYVIYTSGSTGKPKGVMIQHNNVYAFICWCRQEFASSVFEIVYATTSICFDLSVYELFYPLSIGKPIRIIENGLHMGKWLKGDSYVLTNSVPVVIENLIKEGRDLSNISVINMAGEPVPLQVQQSLDTDRIEVRNLYGPTEDTTYSTVYRLRKDMPILIGKPVSNSGVYIINRKGMLAPVGVAGEICIGGAGVARGYLNQPELTAEKFVPDHFSKEPGAKLYHTGDLGRWLADGNIEYMGRIDDQVKIRGFRIELGEVETALNDLTEISSSCVVVKKHANSSNTLVSYFVPDKQVVKEKERQLYQAQVLSWKEVYEIEYEQTEGKDSVDEEFNIIGWNDSFTGGAIPAQQMAEWVHEIVDRILYSNPQNILEIGCGTGLLYYQLAGKINKYIGTDFSRSSINQINQRISKGLRNYGSTQLYVSAAHEIKVNNDEDVDTVILNSVVQYFPGEEYMDDVIRNSIGILNGKGRIIIGDVRDNRLLGLFKGRLQLNKMQQSVNVKEFNWAVDLNILKEEELCLSPEYFYRLQSVYPQVTHVDIQWKKASYINELSLYRYTVVIYVGMEDTVMKPAWQSLSGQTEKEIVTTQIQNGVSTIALKDVINPRLWKERQLAKAMKDKMQHTVSDLLSAVEKEDKENIATRELLELAVEKGYQYRFFVDQDPFKINILLELEPIKNFVEQLYIDKTGNGVGTLTNIPLFTDISMLLQKDIRVFLKQRLPEYMVPSEMIALAKLPLNSNGKIDRKFLSQREDIAVINKLNYQPPGTDLEAKLAIIWQDLLRIERVGILDNFFELGGHSLLVMRLISAVRKELGIELAIKDLFTYSSISKLAQYLESFQSTALMLPPVEAIKRPEYIPLSFSQERLWFIDSLEGSTPFHLPAVLQFKGRLNKEALAYALQTIVDRHEVLRTVFRQEDGRPYQLVKEKHGWQLSISEHIEYSKNTAALQLYIRELLIAPFDLSNDYTLRAELIITGKEEHVLVATLHHIASDAWSKGIMINEVVELYTAFVEERPVSLPALQIQYADYAIWQRHYLTGELLNHKLNYWKDKLNAIEPLQLPADFPRPPLQSTKGTTARFVIDKHLSNQLKGLSQQYESTLYMTMLAAFKVLLYRYSGQQDICVGTSIAGRQQQEIESLIGFFVNILALRTTVSPDNSFIALLEKVKQTTLEAYDHQEVPFEKVVDAVVKERDISRSPLFQVLFVMLNTPVATETALGDLALSAMEYEHSSAKYDLTFFVTETAEGLSGTVEYSTELYREQTITRMMAHFVELLHAVVKDPSGKIAELRLMSKAEEIQLLQEFNDTKSVYPKDKTIIDLFEQQVKMNPTAIALVFEAEEISYRLLSERADKLAHYLQSKGVKEESMVPICMERSVDMMVGILGILKAGGAYVPIDAHYPGERFSFMLEDTGSKLLVTSEAIAQRLPARVGIEMILIDKDWPVISRQAGTVVPTGQTPSGLAYVIYTSGSTGQPKGVMVTNQNVVSLVKGVKYTSFSEQDILLSTGSFSFDATTFEYWGMLLNGGRLVICNEQKLLDAELLKEEIKKRKVSKMWFTSGWFNQLVDHDVSIFNGLRTILVGGEKLSEPHILRLRRFNPSIEIINAYGPTENTTFSLTCNIETAFKNNTPIGKPLSNRTAFIFDTQGQLVPVGIAGEIFLGGDGLSRGYLNRPDLTKEKFIDHPFAKPGAKIYRTGDIGRWLPDGNIEYLGRTDDQVKIRGFRIELGEIENVLLQCPLVKDAAVLAKSGMEGTKRLVGYIVPQGDYRKQEIQHFLQNKLPDYMVPALFVEMEHLPLNHNGKVDRKALPDPDMSDIITNLFEAPRTHVEKVLASIWQRLLDLDEVGIHDNFFELGGDSLLAIRVVSATRKELEVEMPVSNLFEYQTIALLAAQIETQTGAVVLPTIKAADRPAHIPLSFSQERLWFIDKLEGTLQYHIPAVMRLKGELNRDALEHAIASVINRHEVLHTVFLQQDGDAYQFVKEIAQWHLPVIDGSALDKPAVQKLVQQLISTPFDLSNDNMLRAHLVMLNKEENILVVTLHHIASDGWSRSILVKEVAEFYAAYNENRKPVLTPLPVQYADFAIWQRKYLQGEILDNKTAYWQNKLQGVEPLQMPLDFPRPPVQTIHGASVGFSFEKDIVAALQNLSQQEGSTLFMTLLAALKVLLYRYTSQQDICVGTGTAGRQQEEVEGLIGFFVNTLALRTEVDPAGNFTSLLKQVRKNTLEAYERQEVPFEKVVDAVIKTRDRSRNPLFQVMFVLQNTPEVPKLELGKLQLSREISEHTTAQFDLSFSITEYAHGLDGSVEYNTDLYKKETIEKLLGHFRRLVISIISDPKKNIGELSMMSAAESVQVLEDFNANDTSYPAGKTIMNLFEEQVAADPAATALVFEDEKLTYGQLNDRANQLAHFLRDKGVAEGSMVAISIERSINMMVGILAILKAGGAYVPIDASYPVERIQFMLEDTAARVVLTSNAIISKIPASANIEIINLDESVTIIISKPTVDVANNNNAAAMAYVIYTSGSTGKPKGVMVNQQNVVSLVKGVDYVGLNKSVVLLSTGSPSFDATTLEYWGMLLNGGQLVLCGEDILLDSKLLKAEIDKRGVNKMWFTSSWFNQLVETHIAVFETLDTVLVGGEKLSEYHIQKFRQTYPQVEIINGYGPTENTTFSLTYKITASNINTAIPVGRPLNNRKAYLLDKNQQPVPVGVAGEIYLGGAGLSAGYLNQPLLTAEKFVKNPFSNDVDLRIYKTGDMGRWLPDGNIEYLGRVDEQVKIRGYRIELGEIETVLQQTNLISQAVVTAWQNADGSKSLAGYIVPTGQYNKATLIAYLQAKLPAYMIPTLWVEMEQLPLTANGKIDKRALPDPDATEILSDQYIAPTSEMEKKLVAIWQDILHLERVGIHDNFFELGGHSLLAMRLISAIRKELNMEVAVKELFFQPTVAALGAYLQTQNRRPAVMDIKTGPRPLHIPLSFSQERLWFVDQLEGSVQYNSPTVLRLKGPLNKEAITYALKNIITRHEALRTVFYELDGKPYQSVKAAEGWQLSVMEGSGNKNDKAALQRRIEKLIMVPFNLSKDYMLRADLLILEEEDHVLVVTMHHIASDGWSLPIIVKEVVESYTAFVEQRPALLEPLPLQYADYAIWQRGIMDGEELINKTAYWKKNLGGVTPLQLPTDYNRPAVRTVRGSSLNMMIDKELSDQLNELSRQQGTTLFMVLLAAYTVMLHRYSNQQDICVGTSIANRPQQELEGLIGFFVNTVALRTAVYETVTFTELLQQVKATTLEAYEHQDVPFEKVVEEVVKERDPARSPLFQVMLVLLNTPESTSLAAGEVDLSNEFFEIKISKFDLTFHVTQSPQGLPVTIVYNTDLFREDTMIRMGGHFKELLKSIIKDPHQTIDLLQMLTEQEEQQLLMEFN